MINDDLTRSAYKGIGLQQREEAMNVFLSLLQKINPKRVIEVGTGSGGLTMFIRDNLPQEVDIYTFEINEIGTHNILKENNIKLYYENIYEPPVDWSKYTLKKEWENLFDITPKLILIDGGNKKAEFNGVAKYLNTGDIIMLHDYSTDKTTFDTLNVWNWLECQYSDVKTSCEAFNLTPFMNEEFLNVAWGCFIKL